LIPWAFISKCGMHSEYTVTNMSTKEEK